MLTDRKIVLFVCSLSNEPLSNDLRKTEISEIKEPPVALPRGSLSEITNKYLVA